MLGPEGAGVFFIRREHLEQLRPINVGWNSVTHPFDYTNLELDLRPSAVRYEGGSANTAGILALGASLDLLAEFGLSPGHSEIADRVLAVTDLACERLRRAGATVVSDRSRARASGIVSFDYPAGDPVALRKACIAAGVVLSYRNGHLRISPHAYNDEHDIDALIDALQSHEQAAP